jgi:hypothetical protein
MTLTLEISPELEEALRTTAERDGLAPDRYVLDRDLPPHLPRAQAELLRRIIEWLPEAAWTRYHALQAKRDAEALTDAEHAELIRLVNEVEIWNARWLEAVAELAKLQGVRFPDLVRELGLGAPAHA